ncbi:MAG: T9SS type A sorting domain-containing protein [Bacteroidetes bacterium]|nr:T9SS type A sorting domain-containing protein [Bacteroidota bacterium]
MITDTCNAAFLCCQPDSMNFIDFLNQGVPISTSFTLTFRPWTGQVVGLTETSNKVNTIFPNPISSNAVLNIQSNFTFISASLMSVSGKIIQIYDINENKINIPSIDSGFYFLVLNDSNFNQYFQKLIIK